MGYFDHTESTESKNSLRVDSLPQNYVQHYVTPMRRRCLAVVNSAGDISATKFTLTWPPLQDLT